MKINRETFLKDLQMVKGGLSPREFIEQSSCFVFANGQIQTFNDEVACRKATDISITGAVQAESLLAILEKFDDKELTIRQNENSQLEFRGKRDMFWVVMDREVFLPIDKVEDPGEWQELPAKFSEAVKMVRQCASIDETKFILTCIHLHPKYMEACDDKQLIRWKVPTGLKESVLVRGSALGHISDLAMTEISSTEHWIHFRNADGLIFSCRKYMEKYPKLDPYMEFEGRDITLPKSIAEAADRAAIFAADKAGGDPIVTVMISKEKIRLSGEGISGGYKGIRDVAYSGPSLKFVISPLLLKDITQMYSEAQISERKLRVKRDKTWEYVTVLGSPEENETAPEEE